MQLQPGEVERFREVQPMHRNVLIRFLMPMESVVVSAVVLPLMFSSGTRPEVALAIWFGLAVVLPASIAFGLRLTTVVTDRRLLTRFTPFGTRKIDLDDIASAETVKYSPIGDVGGWGVKFSRKFGTVFNVSGEHGVFLNFVRDGKDKKMLIGSEHPGDLAAAIGKPLDPEPTTAQS